MNDDVPSTVASMWDPAATTAQHNDLVALPHDHVCVMVSPVPEGTLNRSRRLMQQLFMGRGSSSITSSGSSGSSSSSSESGGLSRSWHGGANVRTISPEIDDTTGTQHASRGLPAAVLVASCTTSVTHAVMIPPDQDHPYLHHAPRRPRGHLFAHISEGR